MKAKRALLYIGCGWQIVRFLALSLLVILVVYPDSRPGFILLLIWPATAELVIAVAFLFLAVNPDRYAHFRNLLLIGKTLDAAPGLFLLIYQAISLFLGLAPPLFTAVPALELLFGTLVSSPVLLYYSLAVITLVDLLFLLLLISLRLSPEEADPQPEKNLPEWSEVELEDE